MKSRAISFLVLGIISLACRALIPSSPFDLASFSASTSVGRAPSSFITGTGTRPDPFILNFPDYQQPPQPATTTIIAINEDTDQVFQTSPPSPVDFAIILKNLTRLGVRNIAISTPLAWDSPDTISLTALDLQLDSLPAPITTAPLSRGPVTTAIPPAFRRASLPLSHLSGDPRLIPVINRIPVPGIVLGGKTSLAAFSLLESEPPGSYLLARWDDRIVLSFPLLAALSQLSLSPADLIIHPGRFIALGPTGPRIPIDPHGRLKSTPSEIPPPPSIPAAALVDAPDTFFTDPQKSHALIRNDLPLIDQQATSFTSFLLPAISHLTRPPFSPITFPRLTDPVEITILLALAALISFVPFPLLPTCLTLLAALAVSHFTLIPATRLWLPTTPAAAAILTFLPFTFLRKKTPAPSPILTPPPSPAAKSPRKTPNKPARKPKQKHKSPKKSPSKKPRRK